MTFPFFNIGVLTLFEYRRIILVDQKTNRRAKMNQTYTEETHRSELTGKNYKLAVRIVMDGQYYRKIEGLVNGKRSLLDMPVWYENVQNASWSMMRDLEYFVNGKHHPTHYNEFPEIQSLLQKAI